MQIWLKVQKQSYINQFLKDLKKIELRKSKNPKKKLFSP